MESCEYMCQGFDFATNKIDLINSEICHLPKTVGMCYLKLQRWYFNKATMMCHQFTFSGSYLEFYHCIIQMFD
jgi:hypothetical protein